MHRPALAALFLLAVTLPAFSARAAGGIVCPDVAEAAQGSLLDQYYLGRAHDEGYCGIEKDKAQAERWYRRAAEQGHTLAAYELGETFFTGDGVAVDYPEAKKWYLVAGKKGHGPSQLRLGFLYAESHFPGLETDYEQAEHWFLRAAEQDAGDARFRLGNFYNNYKKPPDRQKAYIWLLRAAEGGHRTAMFDLGRLLQTGGDGVPRDAAKGLEWMTRAAKAGVVQAQMHLSHAYAVGEGVGKDPLESLKWTLRIANAPTASVFWLNKAGDIFFHGWEGVPVNYPTARGFYERAALKEDPHALSQLARMYGEGLGVEKDADKAGEYLRRAGAD